MAKKIKQPPVDYKSLITNKHLASESTAIPLTKKVNAKHKLSYTDRLEYFPDDETKTFFSEYKKGLSPVDYDTMLEQYKEAGSPKVHDGEILNKLLGGSGFFNPLTNTISTNPKFKSSYFSELPHAMQRVEKGAIGMTKEFLEKDLPLHLKKKVNDATYTREDFKNLPKGKVRELREKIYTESPYQTEGTIEYDAHKIRANEILRFDHELMDDHPPVKGDTSGLIPGRYQWNRLRDKLTQDQSENMKKIKKAQYGYDLLEPNEKVKREIPQIPTDFRGLLDKAPIPTKKSSYAKLEEIYSPKYDAYLNTMDKSHGYSYQGDNALKLKTGKFNRASVPKKLVEEAYSAAEKEGIDPYLLYGMIGQESTFGGALDSVGKVKSKRNLVSGWNLGERYNPPHPLRFLADKKAPGVKAEKTFHGYEFNITDEAAMEDYLSKNPKLRQQYIRAVQSKTVPEGYDQFREAAKWIKNKGFKSYNPGDDKYEDSVMNSMNLLKKDPIFSGYVDGIKNKRNTVKPDPVKLNNDFQQGGVIEDNRGQWAHPGKVTKINSNNITMKGVPYPVLGVSDTGQKKIMKPGKNYKFKGKSVTEFPIAQNGYEEVTMADYYPEGTGMSNPAGSGKTPLDAGGGMTGMGLMNMGTGILQGVQMIGQERKQKNQAKQYSMLSDLTKQVASLPYDGPKRKYVRPEDMVFDPNQMSPSYGTGTNFLQLQKGGTVPIKAETKGELYKYYNSAVGHHPISPIYAEDDGRLSRNILIDRFNYFNKLNNSGPLITDEAPPGVNSMVYSAMNAVRDKKRDFNGFTPYRTKYSGGGEITKAQFGAQAGSLGAAASSKLFGGTGQQSGAGQIGTSVGSGIGSIFGPLGEAVGGFAGGAIGGIFGAKGQKDTKNWMDEGNLNMSQAAFKQAMQGQFSANMAMGGELKTHWGGKAEEVSTNPYLPSGGESVEFIGDSHKEGGIGVTFGNSSVEVEGGEPAMKLKNGGKSESLVVFGDMKIPSYGVSEIGDPKAKGKKFKNYVSDLNKQEAKQNQVVSKGVEYVNEANPNDAFDRLSMNSGEAMMIGGNMKLKNIATKKNMASIIQNAILETAQEKGLKSDELAKGVIKRDPKAIKTAQHGTFLDKDSPFMQWVRDFQTMPGARPQPQTHNPQEQTGVSQKPWYLPEDNSLTSGNMQPIPGEKPTQRDYLQSLLYKPKDSVAPTYVDSSPFMGSTTEQGYVPQGQSDFERISSEVDPDKTHYGYGQYYYPKDGQGQGQGAPKDIRKKSDITTTKKKHTVPLEPQMRMIEAPGGEPYKPITMDIVNDGTPIQLTEPEVTRILDSKTPAEKQKITQDAAKKGLSLLDYIGAYLPYLRPSNQQNLDPNQLMGEMFALSNNNLEPVQAQKYSPLLETPTKISYQDALNANQSDFNRISRQLTNNPEALASLAGQKYSANSQVIAEQERQNQDRVIGAANRNRGVLNDATLKNLAILDQQYTRQAGAKSNTKAVAQAALNSISDKIAKNKLENRTLGIYENMYNYRFGPQGRAWNMNAPAQFNTEASFTPIDEQGNVTSTSERTTDYGPFGQIKGSKTKYKNVERPSKKAQGGIVKSMKGY